MVRTLEGPLGDSFMCPGGDERMNKSFETSMDGSLLHFYLHKDTHLHFGTSDYNDMCIALKVIIMI